jgi:NDP-sugar pyrophosphorylase family protein
MLTAATFFDLGRPEVRKIFEATAHVWDALPRLPDLISELVGNRQEIQAQPMPGAHISNRPIYIHRDATIEPGAYILGPAYIGPRVVIRHGAYIRENCILLEGALLGHASEAKNAILLPHAKAPHFAYVGDSILGANVNLGAGTKLSNLPLTPNSTVQIPHKNTRLDTGLTKFGAIIGDSTQTGCNVVTNPGTLIGRNCLIYPNLNVPKGYHPDNTILKLRQRTESTHRHP